MKRARDSGHARGKGSFHFSVHHTRTRDGPNHSGYLSACYAGHVIPIFEVSTLDTFYSVTFDRAVKVSEGKVLQPNTGTANSSAREEEHTRGKRYTRESRKQ